MKANGIIALLTDFGSSDWFVASMKATATTIYPDVRTIDITHQITPGSIAEGAFVLKQCFDDFPPGTTFVVVVDPGVGTSREPVVIAAGDYYFVGPNNGILSPTLSQLGILEAHLVESRNWMGKKRSSTFHGRDLFAPAGALVASGRPISDAGPSLYNLVSLQFPEPQEIGDSLTGQILYFDRFGNGLSNFRIEHLGTIQLAGVRVEDTLFPLANTFGEVDDGAPLCYWGSAGFLEVALRNGNAKTNAKLTTLSRVWPVVAPTST